MLVIFVECYIAKKIPPPRSVVYTEIKMHRSTGFLTAKKSKKSCLNANFLNQFKPYETQYMKIIDALYSVIIEKKFKPQHTVNFNFQKDNFT